MAPKSQQDRPDMPRVAPADQIARLIEGLASAGYALVNNPRLADRPAQLVVANGDGQQELRVFCWNVTSGGRGRAATEYRVQTTRPNEAPLYVPGPLNLVLGYDGDRDVFVAWEARKHDHPGASSSLQVPLETLEEAAATGMSAHARSIDYGAAEEVVTAFAPELIGHYLAAHPGLNVGGMALAEATAEAASGVDRPLEELPGDVERRRTISEIARLARDGRFRVGVLRAYDGCCAFCDLGAGLAQAAHIQGVGNGGPDLIVNGVAACPTHHRAFDLGLILVDDDLTIRLNDGLLDTLGVSRAHRDRLAAGLRQEIRVPAEARFRPSAAAFAWHRDRFE